jgi:IclR family KDG regulon transcriptional repressor
MKKDKSEYTIQTVANALRLLEEFHGEEDLGVTELSKRLVLHKNNVFRLLATLEQRGYIEQRSETDRYGLGPGCLALGQSFLNSRDLLRRARPNLVGLAQDTGESVNLGVMKGFEVVHLDGVASSELVGSPSRIGVELPIHCTALGKVLLACSHERVRENFDRSLEPHAELERKTRRTIVDRSKFFEHIRTVAVQGHAFDLEECALGLTCAAVPVFDARGEVVAAISVSGPSFRLRERTLLDRILPPLTAAADRLSRDLGYGVA